MWNPFKRFFEKPKPLAASRLYSPDDVPDSIESVEAAFARLQRFQPLVRYQPILQEMVEYEMAFAERVITDPAKPAETAQFFRGAFWLAKQIGQKLATLEDQLAQKDRELTKLRKKPENIVRREL